MSRFLFSVTLLSLTSLLASPLNAAITPITSAVIDTVETVETVEGEEVIITEHFLQGVTVGGFSVGVADLFAGGDQPGAGLRPGRT